MEINEANFVYSIPVCCLVHEASTQKPEVCLLHRSGSLLCLQAESEHHAAFFCVHAAEDLMPG